MAACLADIALVAPIGFLVGLLAGTLATSRYKISRRDRDDRGS